MPAYNEEANIEAVIKQWYSVLKGKDEASRLVVAASGSTDRTNEILTKMKSEYPQLEILNDTEKYHGPKVISLYDYAIKMQSDFIFQTDSDGQTNPDEFQTFWEMRSDYDGIFGNRCSREDGRGRDFVERVVCFLLRLYFGVNVPDANAPFRLMRTSVAAKYLYMLAPDYNIPNIMITTYFVHYKERVSFEPVSFKPRQGGKNSINIFRIISIGCKALRDFKSLRRKMVN